MTINVPKPLPFVREWPEADLRLLNPAVSEPPVLLLDDVLTPRAAEWVAATAEGAGAPADYVALALFSTVGSLVGNSRWVHPWPGWAEPPVLWGMCVGNPSAGKSPAIDAVLAPLRQAERPLRESAEAKLMEWERQAEVAAIFKSIWAKQCEKALKNGEDVPPMLPEADAGRRPHVPRLVVSDATVERLGIILNEQPTSILQMRDELAGWLLTMEARNRGSDRAFWLEAYGGRAFPVERVGREPLTVERLTIGVLGGIQPDRLSELLLKSTDDGLLARFLPVWPHRTPPQQPQRFADDALAGTAFAKLVALEMPMSEDGIPRPWFVPFDAGARELMNDWRIACADWEAGVDGLLLSFIGKLPGMAARLSLVLAAIGYAFDNELDPAERHITPAELGRARHYLETYALPMARRCYGAVSAPKAEIAARRLVSLIREKNWQSFTARDVQRAGRRGLTDSKAVKDALAGLAEADIVAEITQPLSPQGGRPTRLFSVNPVALEAQS